MTYADETARAGRQPFGWIEIDLGACANTYGVAPCTAALGVTGSAKCFNSWSTCQDPTNFIDATKTFKFCTTAPAIPLDQGFIPLLRDARMGPGEVDPGMSMGKRGSVRFALGDAPHDDYGVDPYVAERSYDPLTRGLFWGRFLRRWPFYLGRALRWYSGFLPASDTVLDQAEFKALFRSRAYVIESIDGPDSSGEVTVTAKDPLKLADKERAKAPKPSKGKLLSALSDVATPSTLDVSTTDDTEYDLKSGESEDYVRVGDEILTYTGTTPIAAGVRLTGVSRAAPSPYETTQQSHDADDAVQRCRFFAGKVIDVVKELLENYTPNFQSAWIPYADWQTEYDTWLAGLTVERLVVDPEGVRSLLDELVAQGLSWGFWWDEVHQQVSYRALRPFDSAATPTRFSDDAHIVRDSVDVADEPERLINEVRVLYGQRDPTGDRGDYQNYRQGDFQQDADSQSDRQTGQKRARTIYARWHPASNESRVRQLTSRILGGHARLLRRIRWRVDRKDDDIDVAQFLDLHTAYLLDVFGQPIDTRVQVIHVEERGDELDVLAREDFFKGNYGRVAPAAKSGQTYTQATTDDRDRYAFIADSAGQMANGDDGTRLI